MEEHNEIQRIKQELFDLLDPVIGTEIGNDDIVYGNYIEWPYLNELDDDMLSNIADILGIDSGYSNREKFIDELVNSGYIEGTEYENGSIDFLNSIKYYYFDDIDETNYLDTSENNLSDSYVKKLDEIKDNISNSNNEKIKISLLNYAFSLTESFISSMIKKKIPDYNSVAPVLKNLIKITIDKQSKSFNGRKSLFKIFYHDYNLEQYKHNELRNILAHNVSICSIENDCINYSFDSNDEKLINIYTVIDELKDYINKVYNDTEYKINESKIEEIKDYIRSNINDANIKKLLVTISKNNINIDKSENKKIFINTQNSKACTIYDLIPFVYNSELSIDPKSLDYLLLQSLINDIENIINEYNS